MPQFFRSNPPLSAESRLNLRVASGATREIAAKDISVDVGPGPGVSAIGRGGKEITAPAFNQNRIDDFLAHASTLPRVFVQVAVSQSIPAGRLVPKGTPVDIVLVPMSNIHFGLFDQTHADLAIRITATVPLPCRRIRHRLTI